MRVKAKQTDKLKRETENGEQRHADKEKKKGGEKRKWSKRRIVETSI